MYIKRDDYLRRLIAKRDNGFIKIITGVRRCGKSFLLFHLYKEYLVQSGVGEDYIVELALDNVLNAKLRDPLTLSEYLEAKTSDHAKSIIYSLMKYSLSAGNKYRAIRIFTLPFTMY